MVIKANNGFFGTVGIFEKVIKMSWSVYDITLWYRYSYGYKVTQRLWEELPKSVVWPLPYFVSSEIMTSCGHNKVS